MPRRFGPSPSFSRSSFLHRAVAQRRRFGSAPVFVPPSLVQAAGSCQALTPSLKAHFTSLLSTISFTLYALLPNLEPALFAAYPVESTSQALQAKSSPPSAPPPSDDITFGGNLRRQITQEDSDGGVGALGSPADTGTTEPTPASTPADSLLLNPPSEGSEHEPTGYTTDGGTAERSAARAPAPGTLAESLASVASSTSSTDATEVTLPAESWASEFTRGSDDELVSPCEGRGSVRPVERASGPVESGRAVTEWPKRGTRARQLAASNRRKATPGARCKARRRAADVNAFADVKIFIDYPLRTHHTHTY